MDMKNLAVLIIEDNKEVAALIGAMLKKAKSVTFDVDMSDSLTAGTELLKNKKFDGILLDLTLPDSSGIETVSRVHALVPDMPIIILTGVDDEHIATAAVKEGAQDYIVKGSSDLNALIRSVIYAIERKTAEVELRKARDELEIRVQERTAELKQAQAHLIQAAKMEVVGCLASGVAHEVKNPLAIILQGVEYLERKIPKNDESVSTTIGYIRNAVERADNIVRGLMDFSSVSQMNMQNQQISPVVEKSLMLLKHNFDKSHIRVKKEFEENLPDISMDRNKIEQVFLNLLMNAADAMSSGGTLTVSIKRGADQQNEKAAKSLIVCITDEGTGIPDDVLDHIFDPFFTTKRTKGGTGLGLPIVRNILETHNAVIKIENRQEKGTKVTVTFVLQ